MLRAEGRVAYLVDVHVENGEDGVGVAGTAVALDGGADEGLAEDEVGEGGGVEAVSVCLEELDGEALEGKVVDVGCGVKEVEIDVEGLVARTGERGGEYNEHRRDVRGRWRRLGPSRGRMRATCVLPWSLRAKSREGQSPCADFCLYGRGESGCNGYGTFMLTSSYFRPDPEYFLSNFLS